MAVASASSPLRARQFAIATVVVSYFVISISMVFLNKVLMDKKSSIEAPLFMTWYQCFWSVLACFVLGEIGKRSPPDSFFRQFPEFRYRVDVGLQLLPLSAVFVGMITFNNLCLQYVEVSFYNVARSLTIVFNVVLTYFMLGEGTSMPTVACLAAVVAGFFVGSEGEVNFSWLGTAFGVLSSVFVSLNSIMTKRSMSVVDGNQWSLAAYNNANAMMMFVPIILLSDERAVLSTPESWELLGSAHYWALMSLGGICGFAIGIVTIMQIKVTSPLTHNISGTAKACVQTVLAFFIWQNATTVANMLGVALVLAGSFAYAMVRNREMEAASAKRAAGLKAIKEPANSPGSGAGGTLEEGGGGGDGSVRKDEMDGPASELVPIIKN